MASTQSQSEKDPNRKPSPRTVPAGIRTYRFVVETIRAGKQYLSIVEECKDGSSEAPCRLVVFQRHTAAFHKEYLKAAKRLEPKLKVFNVVEIRED